MGQVECQAVDSCEERVLEDVAPLAIMNFEVCRGEEGKT